MDLAASITSSVAALLAETDLTPHVVELAEAVVVLRVLRGGFLWTGSVSGGLVVRRLGRNPSRWSPPSSVGMLGVGFGLAAGLDVVTVVLCLATKRDVDTFCSEGTLKFGADFGATVVWGRSFDVAAVVGNRGFTGIVAFTRSKGLYAGLTLEGATIDARPWDNVDFYRARPCPVRSILAGYVTPPPDRAWLVELLHSTLIDMEMGRTHASVGHAVESPVLATAPLGNRELAASRQNDADEDEAEAQELARRVQHVASTGKMLLGRTLSAGSASPAPANPFSRVVEFTRDHVSANAKSLDSRLAPYPVVDARRGDRAVLMHGDLATGLGGDLPDYVRVHLLRDPPPRPADASSSSPPFNFMDTVTDAPVSVRDGLASRYCLRLVDS